MHAGLEAGTHHYPWPEVGIHPYPSLVLSSRSWTEWLVGWS